MTANPSRQQRRALERYAHGVDIITASDKRWFEEHPGREFRVRHTSAAEIGSAAAVGALRPAPDGTARFTLIRKLTANCRTRIFIFGPPHKTGNETNDATAAALWQHHLAGNPALRERELAISAIVEDRDHARQGDSAA